jgi:hypothetical protein
MPRNSLRPRVNPGGTPRGFLPAVRRGEGPERVEPSRSGATAEGPESLRVFGRLPVTGVRGWIRRRLRSYLWRQWQNGHNRFKELRRRGVPKFHAAVAAGSPTGFLRMSGHPAVQQALRNHYFDSLGLPRLYVSAPA